MEGVVPVAHFLDLLPQHFATLTRGYLGSEDLDRSAAIVRAHHRYGVDLSWYVLAYREFQGRITAALRQGGHHDLAEAMRELFSWDMGIFLHAYQKTLDQDDVTRLMRRRTFFEQMSLDIQQRLENRTGAFALLQLKGLARVIERQGRHVSQRLLQQVGEILQSYTSAQTLVGRLDGDEIGVWISSATPQTLDQIILRLTIDIKQKAPPLRGEVQTVWLGQDGTTAEALYAAANRQMMKDATSSPSPSF